jgi:hypothetical protein
VTRFLLRPPLGCEIILMQFQTNAALGERNGVNMNEIISGVIKPFLDLLSHLFDLVFNKIGVPPQIVSAFILSLIVVVLLGLLIYFSVSLTRGFGRRRPLDDVDPQQPEDDEDDQRPDSKSKQELVAENGRYRKRLAQAKSRIETMLYAPEYTPLEKFYFAINGVTNSALILGIGILLYDFLRLRFGHATPTISTEVVVGRIMGVLASAVLLSGLLVFISKVDRGRSFERINRSFQISLAVAIAAFIVFITYILPL